MMEPQESKSQSKSNFKRDSPVLSGDYTEWTRVADSGRKATYRFCPSCGSTVAYRIEEWEGVTAIPVGAFADPNFPAPEFSVFEHRKHRWVAVTGDVEHSSSPTTIIPATGDQGED